MLNKRKNVYIEKKYIEFFQYIEKKMCHKQTKWD